MTKQSKMEKEQNKTKMKSKRQQYQQSFVHLWYVANILKVISKFKKKLLPFISNDLEVVHMKIPL